MPRTQVVLTKLIQETEAQLVEDRNQLAKLKAQQIAVPSEHTQRFINAARQTLSNGQMDLDDLKAEYTESVAFEASEAGQQRREDAAQKLLAVDGLIDVCAYTAVEADKAMNKAWMALRKHYAAHQALRSAVGAAYSAVTADTGYDPDYNQLWLLQEYSELRNGGVAMAEWVSECLKGFDLDSIIEVDPNFIPGKREHVTLGDAHGKPLGRCWHRMKEVAQRCGVPVHAPDHPALPVIRQALLKLIMEGEVQ